MGVTGLWKLIEPCGKPVPLETLESKILAVDISIWLHQVVKGFQDNKGSALPNAHLLGLFNRLCKLLYYRVKPVFVFDGCVPQLKRDTIARRQLQRSKLNSEAERIQVLLLQSLAKEKVVQQALGGKTAELLAKSPNKGIRNTSSSSDDIFKLPEITIEEDVEGEVDGFADYSHSFNDDSICEYGTTSTDESFDESNARQYYNSNLHAIDFKSKHFKALPTNVQYEILMDVKETRKQSSWGRLHELPAKGDDFSVFQMKRLLKRRAVQESIEEVEQKMGGRLPNFDEMQTLLAEEDIIEKSTIDGGSKKISSDENSRFLLVRDLKKKEADSFNNETIKLEKIHPNPKETSPSVLKHSGLNKASGSDNFGTEFDKDMELALALSLEDCSVYNEKDYDYESDHDLKLNVKQSKELKHAAIGPARAFMIEYAGVNNEELLGIMSKTQNINEAENALGVIDVEPISLELETENNSLTSLQKLPDDELEEQDHQSEFNCDINTDVQTTISKESLKKMNQSHICSEQKIDSSDTDSELEEVQFNNNKTALENKLEMKTETQELINTENELKNVQTTTLTSLTQTIDSSDTDSDLEEVQLQDLTNDSTTITSIKEFVPENKKLEVVVDLTKSVDPEDDLFSDIFSSNMNKSNKDDFSIKTENITNTTLKSQESAVKLLASLDTSNLGDVQIDRTKNKKSSIDALLQELKKQSEDIKNIKLEDIRLELCTPNLTNNNASEIDILSENIEKSILKTPEKTIMNEEIIEILDDEDRKNKFCENAPLLKTPSKSKTITEFFQTDYRIKRTPETNSENGEMTGQVRSPFFINKKRSAEKTSESECTDAKVSKALKSLFPSQVNARETVTNSIDENERTAADLLQEAAFALKEQVSVDELKELATNLSEEKRNLENERNRQDRMGMGITQRMVSECQQLLRLFGIPYIVAPMEAEAQCAYLDGIGLTNGTITDDSDIWLFGGRTVYKNFFAQNKHVLEFRAENIEKSFNCDRSKLIQLACLVGSDYTTGINGIGAVTAMEILATFCPKDQMQNTKSPVAAILMALIRFRDWWIASKSTAAPPGSSARLALRKKLKNIELHDGFPNKAVIDAYLSPKVDGNKESFAWGIPDVESILDFARNNFGWTTSKTNEILTPVIKKINEKKTQATIKNYFSVKSTVSIRELKVSKRIKKAIDKMSGKTDETAEEETKALPKNKQKKRKSNLNLVDVINEDESNNDLTSNSTAVRKKSVKLSNRKGNKNIIPCNNKEVISQRVKDLEEMDKRKEKAAQILKKNRKINVNATK